MKTKFIVKRFVYLALILVALMKSYAQDKLHFVFQDFEVFKNQKTNTGMSSLDYMTPAEMELKIKINQLNNVT